MICNKLACYALLSLGGLLCLASPVRQRSTPIYEQAKNNLPHEIQEAGIHSDSTVEDLAIKLPPILGKYDNQIRVSRIAYEYLRDLGISEDKIDLFKYHRNLATHQVQDRRYREMGTGRKKWNYRPRKGTIPTPKKGPVSITTQGYRRARDLKHKELFKRIKDAGYGDETDPKVLLRIQDEVKGNMTPLMYGQALAVYMTKKTKDKEWYHKFVKARDVIKMERYRERKKLGLVGMGLTKKSTPVEDSFTSNFWKSPSSGADINRAVEPEKGSPTTASTSASRKKALRPRRRLRNFTVSSDEGDDSDWVPSIRVKDAKNEALAKINVHSSILDKWPTGPRSMNRMPRKSYSVFNPKASQADQPLLFFDEHAIGDWRDTTLSPHTINIRPTTGVKKYRGAQAGSPIDPPSESGSSSTNRPSKRPTIAKKKFTGAATYVPQTAGLAPKKLSPAGPP